MSVSHVASQGWRTENMSPVRNQAQETLSGNSVEMKLSRTGEMIKIRKKPLGTDVKKPSHSPLIDTRHWDVLWISLWLICHSFFHFDYISLVILHIFVFILFPFSWSCRVSQSFCGYFTSVCIILLAFSWTSFSLVVALSLNPFWFFRVILKSFSMRICWVYISVFGLHLFLVVCVSVVFFASCVHTVSVL